MALNVRFRSVLKLWWILSQHSIEEKFNFYSLLCDVFNSDRVIDLIILNDAEPILAFEAISGIRIIDNYPEKTASYCSYISRVYEDTMVNIQYQHSLYKRTSN